MKSKIAALIAARQPAEPQLGIERHYTLEEIAELWGTGRDYVRKAFEGVDGVLLIGKSEKRNYVRMMVPQSVVIREHRRLSKHR